MPLLNQIHLLLNLRVNILPQNLQLKVLLLHLVLMLLNNPLVKRTRLEVLILFLMVHGLVMGGPLTHGESFPIVIHELNTGVVPIEVAGWDQVLVLQVFVFSCHP